MNRLGLAILALFTLSKVYCYVGLRFLYPFSQFLARDWVSLSPLLLQTTPH